MYRTILLPTDGSELSRSATKSAVRFSKNTGARLVALHVLPGETHDVDEEWLAYGEDMAERRREFYAHQGAGYLAFVANCAVAQAVQCECLMVRDDFPYRAIIYAARQHQCDLIFMGSHGRLGNELQMLGSEAIKVATLSPVPVMLHRPRERGPA
jgi:nucleotide-binding universal stress UspA family protein